MAPIFSMLETKGCITRALPLPATKASQPRRGKAAREACRSSGCRATARRHPAAVCCGVSEVVQGTEGARREALRTPRDPGSTSCGVYGWVERRIPSLAALRDGAANSGRLIGMLVCGLPRRWASTTTCSFQATGCQVASGMSKLGMTAGLAALVGYGRQL